MILNILPATLGAGATAAQRATAAPGTLGTPTVGEGDLSALSGSRPSGSSTTASTESPPSSRTGAQELRNPLEQLLHAVVRAVVPAVIKFLEKIGISQKPSTKPASSKSETKESENPLVKILEALVKFLEGEETTKEGETKGGVQKPENPFVLALKAAIQLLKLLEKTESSEKPMPQPNNPITVQETGLPSSASGTSSVSAIENPVQAPSTQTSLQTPMRMSA